MNATPRLTQLCVSLATQAADVARHVEVLLQKLGVDSTNCLVLLPALHNIVDRQKDILATWRVVLGEPIETPIEAELLE